MVKRALISCTALVFMALIVLVDSAFLKVPYGIKLNRSNSLPYWAFISFRNQTEPLQQGSLVSFYLPGTNIKLVKRIAGMPGDVIRIEFGCAYVNSEVIGPIFSQAPSGATLTPIALNVIPEGYVFVRGDHPQSYDSRYAECGLLRKTDIEEVLWPLF